MDLDVAAVEAAEKSIDEFINKRAKDKAAANKEEQEQQAAARRVREKRRRANRWAWISHHGHMHSLHLDLASEHARKRSRLMLEGGYEPDESPGQEAAAS